MYILVLMPKRLINVKIYLFVFKYEALKSFVIFCNFEILYGKLKDDF